MSMKKILMLGVMTAFVAPVMLSSAIASKTMGQILLEQNQKHVAEQKAAEQKRVAEEQKAVAAEKQVELKGAVGKENAGLEAKINNLITQLNAKFGTNVALAKADDTQSLENAIDTLGGGLVAMEKSGKIAGKAKGGVLEKIAQQKQQAYVLNLHLDQIIPNHKAGVIADDLNNLNPVLQAADAFIGKVPRDIMTKDVQVVGAPISITEFIGKLKTAVKAAHTALPGGANGKDALKKALTDNGLDLN